MILLVSAGTRSYFGASLEAGGRSASGWAHNTSAGNQDVVVDET
jgi:hypothetical protein